MNKQEVIEYILEDKYAFPKIRPETDEGSSVEFKNGYNEGLENASRIVGQKLDEPAMPKKVVVPQYVADWIEEHTKNDKSDYPLYSLMEDYLADNIYPDSKILRWYNDNPNAVFILADAMRYGYKVEKPKKYKIRVGDSNYFYGWVWLEDGTVAGILPMAIPGEKAQIKLYASEEEAEADCEMLGGEIEEV